MNLGFSVFLVRTTKNINYKFKVGNFLFNFDTGLFLIFGHVICPANFKRANYNYWRFIFILPSFDLNHYAAILFFDEFSFGPYKAKLSYITLVTQSFFIIFINSFVSVLY